jgi:hypothetical protein
MFTASQYGRHCFLELLIFCGLVYLCALCVTGVYLTEVTSRSDGHYARSSPLLLDIGGPPLFQKDDTTPEVASFHIATQTYDPMPTRFELYRTWTYPFMVVSRQVIVVSLFFPSFLLKTP